MTNCSVVILLVRSFFSSRLVPSYLILGLPFSSNRADSHGLNACNRQWWLGGGTLSNLKFARFLAKRTVDSNRKVYHDNN